MRYNHKKSILVFFLTGFSICSGFAQKLPAGPQVLTSFSAADDTEQPYGLYLPKNFDADKKYPLVIMLHGAGSNHRLALRRVFGKSNAIGENDVEATRYFPAWNDVDYIVASPYARGTMGYQGIAEQDVYDVLADVKKRFPIDEDRIYLTGLSMGGGGTLWIGLTRPDIWAALAPVCPAPPKGTDDFAPNALNLPMHFFHGDVDQAVPVAVSRDWTKKLKASGTQVEYTEYPGVQHNSWENAYADEAIFEWLGKFKRNRFPSRVRFSTTRYKYHSAYWVRFDKFTPGTVTSIDAHFTGGNKIQLTTTSLEAFTLILTDHPEFKAGEPVEVVINGGKAIKVQDSSGSISFLLLNNKWVADKYQAPPLTKKVGEEGPIAAAFEHNHLYVYGTGGDPTADEQKARVEVATTAANWSVYRNAFLGRIMVFPRVVSDKEVRLSDFQTSNLILFGTKETNSIIEKYSDKLPLHLTPTTKEFGLFYVFPMNEHYVAVNSGLPWWTGADTKGNPFLPPSLTTLSDLKDFILFKGAITTVIAGGYFDQAWKLSAQDSKKIKDSGVVRIKP